MALGTHAANGIGKGRGEVDEGTMDTSVPGQDLGPIGQDITGRQPQISVNFEPLNFCGTLLNRIISYYHMVGLNPLLISINGQTIDPLMPDQAKRVTQQKSLENQAR